MAKSGSMQGFALGCVNADCIAIRKGFDVRVAGNIGSNLYSKATLEKILKNGFVDKSGNPIPIQIFQTS